MKLIWTVGRECGQFCFRPQEDALPTGKQSFDGLLDPETRCFGRHHPRYIIIHNLLNRFDMHVESRACARSLSLSIGCDREAGLKMKHRTVVE